jgi:PAS domain S-box-containing protein
MNTARDPMIILDAYLNVLAANKTFYSTFQVIPSETENRKIFSIGNNQWNIQKLKTLLEEILPAKTSFEDFEVDHDFPKIGKRNMLLNARQFLGSPPLAQKLILLSIEDITAKVKAEKLSARLTSIVEFTDDAIASKNSDGIILTWNHGAERMYGYTEEEAIGKNISMLAPPNTPDEIPELIKRIFDGEVIHHYETVRKTKGGKLIDVSLSLGPMKLQDGTIYAVSKIARNITTRKRLERERNAALQAREELIGVVSHEIKTPLTAIISSLDLIKRILPPFEGKEKVQKLINNIYISAHRMTRITSDLLEVSKIESGHLGINIVIVDVPKFIEEVVVTFQSVAAERSIRIETKIAPEVHTINCDRDRINQVLTNLLANAIKFTAVGGVIRIVVERAGDLVRFEVKDTGCGIPADQTHKVFERFWQAKNKQYMGAGLGLYIAKNIIIAHGGNIGLDSKVGEGSTFYFILPAIHEAVTEIPKKIA